jgi:hypothetical protein
MAGAFLKKHGPDRFNPSDADLEPTEIDPITGEVMQEIGIEREGRDN